MTAVFQGNIPVLTACHIKRVPVFLPVKRIKVTDEDHIGIRQFLIILSAPEQLHINLAVIISAPFSGLSLTEHLHLYIIMCILLICRQYVQPYTFVLRMVNKTLLFAHRHLRDPEPQNKFQKLPADLLIHHHSSKHEVILDGKILQCLTFCHLHSSLNTFGGILYYGYSETASARNIQMLLTIASGI